MDMNMNLLSQNLVARSLGLQPVPSDSQLMGERKGSAANGKNYGHRASLIRLSHARRAIHDSVDDEDDFRGEDT